MYLILIHHPPHQRKAASTQKRVGGSWSSQLRVHLKCDVYLVSGAGNNRANGLYIMQNQDEDGTISYVKESSAVDEPLMTLFRCAMKNSSKWWFISSSEGDRDVDFYQHKSTSWQDHEPPLRGWVTFYGTNGLAPGRDPPPMLWLSRAGTDLLGSVPLELHLFAQLPQWILQQDILGYVFTTSPHREIISRSTKLIAFLAESQELLTAEHVMVIWRAAMASHDTDIVDEILASGLPRSARRLPRLSKYSSEPTKIGKWNAASLWKMPWCIVLVADYCFLLMLF